MTIFVKEEKSRRRGEREPDIVQPKSGEGTPSIQPLWQQGVFWADCPLSR
jgi:hypothetical protein